MHENLSFCAQKSKKILGIAPPQTTPLVAHPTPLGAFGISFFALAMIRPPLFKP